MSPRTLLGTGLGLLLLGLLLGPGLSSSSTGSQHVVFVQGYLSHVAATVGAGLVVVAALVSALRPSGTTGPAPALDHYS